MAVAFKDVGHFTGRVPVPAGAVQVATVAEFRAELNKVLPGGVNAGDSVDLHFTGTFYYEIGIEGYVRTDGGTGLRLYGNQDGSTRIGFIGTGGVTDRMLEAHSACIRVGSAENQFDPNSHIEIYNFELDGGSTGDGIGAKWGLILGGANDVDAYRSNVSQIFVQGVEVHHTQNSGIKIDGNGGTDGVTIQQVTVREVGQQYEGQSGVEGLGEGIYCGDGGTGRAYSNVLLDRCHVYGTAGNVNFGEGINTKRNGTNVEIRDCVVHDIEIDNGGGIACEEYAEVRGCRVWGISRNGFSDTNYPAAVAFERGGLVENCVIWTDHPNGSCVNLIDEAVASTVTVRHSLLDASNGRTCYSLNEFGGSSQALVAEFNVTLGNATSGTNGTGGSRNDFAASSGDFVGPLTGVRDAGSGEGSGYEQQPGSAIIDGASGSGLALDIQGLSRTGTPDLGPFEVNTVPDTTDPTSTIVFPVHQGFVDTNDTVTVQVSAADTGGSGVDTVRLYARAVVGGVDNFWDGSAWVPLGTVRPFMTYNAATGYWEHDVDFTEVGNIVLRTIVTDVAGNQQSAAEGPLATITVETRDYEIVVPSNNVSGVATDSYTLSGNAPFRTTAVWVRVTNETDNQVLTADGVTYVADVDPEAHWLPCTYVSGGFSYGPFDQPPGRLMKIDSRRAE